MISKNHYFTNCFTILTIFSLAFFLSHFFMIRKLSPEDSELHTMLIHPVSNIRLGPPHLTHNTFLELSVEETLPEARDGRYAVWSTANIFAERK